ncbi:type II toxin-antitoxin system MqsA family antitoxin [Burkholderia territorii]|uniref:type II toxin-antitoxin system MqsA family antitoxin n=1 Tax=Burkholderia territorii TaxID=1503055 RepID=UPI0009C087B7|nr:type II toxin-antitoxin system MqsA family antitoxin [Burkholderia territorii]
MRCPSCGATDLVHDTRDIKFTYKGETTSIPAVSGRYCDACGDSLPDAGEGDRISSAALEFKTICDERGKSRS